VDIHGVRREVTPLLQPLTVIQRQGHELITLEGTLVFENALFRTKILLSVVAQTVPLEDGSGTEQMSSGQARLFGEDLLVEDLPIFVDEPRGAYG
jgi:hypothetical protein